MKVIVVPDGYEIRAVHDNGTGCKHCVFNTLEADEEYNEQLVNYCLLNPNHKIPCINTIYMVMKDPEDDDDIAIM